MEKKWWKESVVYQIYPRSFKDSNGDGIGDINGITEKLDYLKELGIDVIWLSPVYQSPNDDNGYDISDYQAIMEEFGTMEDFDRMLAEAHKIGIRIVMDLVVNHTSDEHAWFVESKKSRENPYRDYYIWREGKDGKEPNNWGSVFNGSAWVYDETTDMYYLHLFSKKQPDLNWDNPKVREEVFSMMNWWCEKGIDGFRMDVISMISKVEGLPDGKVQGGLYGDASPYVQNGPHVHEYLQEMNKEVLSKYDLLTVGECAGVTIEEAKKYASNKGTELGMVFQFEHMDLDQGEFSKWSDKKVKLTALKENLTKWQNELEGKAWNSLFWCNHDQPRVVSRFGNDSKEYREVSAKMLATCLHLMQGTPYVYQGEELGMTNVSFHSIDEIDDCSTLDEYQVALDAGLTPESAFKAVVPYSRDNARTPFQWDATANAGFTTGTPWLKVNPNYTDINAAEQANRPDSMYHWYKELIALRKNPEYKDVVVYGEVVPYKEEQTNLMAYYRKGTDRTLLVIANYQHDAQDVVLPGTYKKVLMNNLETLDLNGDILHMPGYQVVIFEM